MTTLIQLAASIVMVVTGFVFYFVFLAILVRMIAFVNTKKCASLSNNALSTEIGSLSVPRKHGIFSGTL